VCKDEIQQLEVRVEEVIKIRKELTENYEEPKERSMFISQFSKGDMKDLISKFPAQSLFSSIISKIKDIIN
jgi:hypothetical protein